MPATQDRHAAVHAWKKAYGMPEHLLSAHPPVDPAVRAKPLDMLLREGVTPSLVRTADWFDRVARQMDRQFTQPIRLDDATDCAEMKYFKDALCDTAEAVCYYAALFPTPLALDACAVCAGACAGAISAYWLSGGWRHN